MEEAPEEIKHEEEVKIENDEENHETEIEAPPAPATPQQVPRHTTEVTPEKLPKPKAKARGRPVGSTSKNTYQQLADRLDQMDAKLREREEQLNARLAERQSTVQEAPSTSRRSGIMLQGGPEEAAAHLISQLGLQAEERHRQKLQMYRSFLPP